MAAPIAVGVALLVGFIGWERHCPHAMIPPALLRARSFVSASAVYLVSYTAFSGVLFYVTLLYQDVDGWSPLRTGLSWLFLNAPFLLAAQLTGRLDRRYPVARVVAAGCVAGAAGVFALSLAAPPAPFAVTAVGFLLCGAGFGLLVPGVTHVAMRDVPPGISGAASSVVNASRQLGTSVGLAVLGTLGVTSAIANWTATAQRFPAALRAEALRQAQNVGGARISAVAHTLGAAYRQPGRPVLRARLPRCRRRRRGLPARRRRHRRPRVPAVVIDQSPAVPALRAGRPCRWAPGPSRPGRTSPRADVRWSPRS